MIIVLTEDGKPVDAFFKEDGTADQIELDTKSPVAKLLKATVDKEEN